MNFPNLQKNYLRIDYKSKEINLIQNIRDHEKNMTAAKLKWESISKEKETLKELLFEERIIIRRKNYYSKKKLLFEERIIIRSKNF